MNPKPVWWEHRWTQVKPMTMMHHHWITGWCTRCSTRVAAPTAMELYDMAKDAECAYAKIYRVGHRVCASYCMGVQAVIDYTNWAGTRELRRIRPHKIWYGANMWHEEPQWLLDAMDLDKNAERTFAFATIHDWTEERLP